MINVGIIGLGLIGSSLLKKLSSNKKYKLFVCSKSSCDKAKQYTDFAYDDIHFLKDCEIIFVCSKANETINTLNKLNEFLTKNTTVVDACSIKKDLLNQNFNFNFILSHPMAGTENTGFDAGFAELFEQNKWLYEVEDELLIQIIKDLGAIPTKINMQEHDKMCAQISHFPAILASLLFKTSDSSSKQIASSGFRDMTRLAITQEDLINSMFEKNLPNIEQSLKNLIIEFENLKNMNSDERIDLFKRISEQRKEMYDKNGKNIFKI